MVLLTCANPRSYRALALFILLLGVSATHSLAQATPDAPTRQEIAQAYRSVLGHGVRSVRWRAGEIRGWKLHIKQTRERESLGVITAQYKVTAKNNSSCAEYQITDTRSRNPQIKIKPILVVQPNGAATCRGLL
jgi:hypothetical protein